MPRQHQCSASGQHGCQRKTTRNFSYPTLVAKAYLTVDTPCSVGHVGKEKCLNLDIQRTAAAQEGQLLGRQTKQAALEQDKERRSHGRGYQPRVNLDSRAKEDCPAPKETRMKLNALHDGPWTNAKASQQPSRDTKSRIHMAKEKTSTPAVETNDSKQLQQRGRRRQDAAMGHRDEKLVLINEPSAEALRQQKRNLLRKHGIEPKDPDAAVKMHLPTGKIPAGVTTLTRGPSPEKAMRQGARDTAAKSQTARQLAPWQ
ncbi:hypothetical protein CDD81_1847 [Ophiocordyceps australis]|uniref:Uncharacterized protein n=1 Tax=Ophiocordyceps australis TaxID=1399860 RepID=A0A2C5Y0C0_9HYPO|nr:hypothetical protein CDD81_1847 [Ophiocordyceps australis]